MKELKTEISEIKRDIKTTNLNLGYHQAELEKCIHTIDILEKYLEELEEEFNKN